MDVSRSGFLAAPPSSPLVSSLGGRSAPLSPSVFSSRLALPSTTRRRLSTTFFSDSLLACRRSAVFTVSSARRPYRCRPWIGSAHPVQPARRRYAAFLVVVGVFVDDGNGSSSESRILVAAVSTASTTRPPASRTTSVAFAAPAVTAAPTSPDWANSCAAASAVWTTPSKTNSLAWKRTAHATLRLSTAAT